MALTGLNKKQNEINKMKPANESIADLIDTFNEPLMKMSVLIHTMETNDIEAEKPLLYSLIILNTNLIQKLYELECTLIESNRKKEK